MVFLLLFFKNEKYFHAEPSAISHIVADDKYSHIHLIKDNQIFTEQHCLQYYQNKLASSGFFLKIGRKLLINRKQIDCFTNNTLTMKNGAQIELGQAEFKMLCSILE